MFNLSRSHFRLRKMGWRRSVEWQARLAQSRNASWRCYADGFFLEPGGGGRVGGAQCADPVVWWGRAGWRGAAGKASRLPRAGSPRLTKVSNSPLSSGSYWWPAPVKPSFCRNLEKRVSTMVSGRRPLAQPPVPPAVAPACVSRSLARPGKAEPAQTSWARSRLLGSRLPARRR